MISTKAGCHSFDLHSLHRRWMKSKEALGLCISETSSRRVESPLPPPENTRGYPPSDTLFPILFSSLFYSLFVELHFIIVYTRKLNEDFRRCEKFKFYVGSFCLYVGTLLGYRYSSLQWRRLEHLWMNCLLRVQPTSQIEEEPNHLVSVTYYENNTNFRGSLSPMAIPTGLGGLYVQFRAFRERQRNRAEEWSRRGHMFQWKVAFIRQKFGGRRSLAGTSTTRARIDYWFHISAHRPQAREFLVNSNRTGAACFFFRVSFFSRAYNRVVMYTTSCYRSRLLRSARKNQTFFLCFINNLIEWWPCRLRRWKLVFHAL